MLGEQMPFCSNWNKSGQSGGDGSLTEDQINWPQEPTYLNYVGYDEWWIKKSLEWAISDFYIELASVFMSLRSVAFKFEGHWARDRRDAASI